MELTNYWANLSQGVKTILERVDINRKDLILVVGQELNIEYFHGIVTEGMVNEIMSYEKSKDNEEEYFSTTRKGDTLVIHFLKGAFD